ncbi:hypothetical protein IscW_ISCW007156 [Ixodes scapularis]|uniref:Uncharacterized protein n=1 Tax=Ixodes scapularis TaxID=6945 RepID=B7PTQ1_IXOSC|nr:hypothetical protein IscW_ISCW007156 [Ixodes scapularis]|eukprot:XP_002404759.1 hypothetical protein IscW_ISCW007156 [Ixodes scapularis]
MYNDAKPTTKLFFFFFFLRTVIMLLGVATVNVLQLGTWLGRCVLIEQWVPRAVH